MKLRIQRIALREMKEAIEYVRLDNPEAAERLAQTLDHALGQLSEFPASGRLGRRPATRELVVGGTEYVLVYKLTPDGLAILRFLHGHRDYPGRR